jgi:SEC-C motif-containing protein
MRSRYSAFVVRDAGYLLRTWATATRPPSVDFDAGLRWTGLDVLATEGGTAFHTTGTVEFRARFRIRGRDGEQRENSRFVREAGLWVYVAEAGAS